LLSLRELTFKTLALLGQVIDHAAQRTDAVLAELLQAGAIPFGTGHELIALGFEGGIFGQEAVALRAESGTIFVQAAIIGFGLVEIEDDVVQFLFDDGRFSDQAGALVEPRIPLLEQIVAFGAEGVTLFDQGFAVRRQTADVRFERDKRFSRYSLSSGSRGDLRRRIVPGGERNWACASAMVSPPGQLQLRSVRWHSAVWRQLALPSRWRRLLRSSSRSPRDGHGGVNVCSSSATSCVGWPPFSGVPAKT
jgi:hypothetical protein